MNTIEAFELIDAISDAMERATNGIYNNKDRTRRFLEVLHERGLTICGTAKPVEIAVVEKAA